MMTTPPRFSELPRFVQTTYRGLPAVMGRSPFCTVTILPTWGAKIASLLDASGREWLWHNPHLPWQLPGATTSYVREADIGGWDECFPAVGPGPYPLPPWQGRPIRDHGEVWAHAWDVEDTADGLRLATTGDEFPYRLTHTVRLANDEPALELVYTVANLSAAIVQILLLDIVFSIDSILTAVGMTEHLPIMVTAVIVAVGMMLLASGPLSAFIHNNPSVVMLALGFLLMIGATLIADGFGVHVPKGYIYAAMAFSGLVEGLNMASRSAQRRKAEALNAASEKSDSLT